MSGEVTQCNGMLSFQPLGSVFTHTHTPWWWSEANRARVWCRAGICGAGTGAGRGMLWILCRIVAARMFQEGHDMLWSSMEEMLKR